MNKDNDIRIAVISIGFRCNEWIERVWKPWTQVSGVYISFVYGVTPENYVNVAFPEEGDRETFNEITNYFNGCANFISHFQESPLHEHELRNIALENLRSRGIEFDYLMILDADDEFYTVEDLNVIRQYIKRDRLISCYRIPFLNYINYNGNLGFYRGFKPCRIWNNRIHGGIDKFFWDNDLCYKNGVSQKDLSTKVIPVEIPHYTWCGSEERLARKVNYQNSHFANGAGCGYSKGEEGVIFNEEYYKKTGERKPVVEWDKKKYE